MPYHTLPAPRPTLLWGSLSLLQPQLEVSPLGHRPQVCAEEEPVAGVVRFALERDMSVSPISFRVDCLGRPAGFAVAWFCGAWNYCFTRSGRDRGPHQATHKEKSLHIPPSHSVGR